MKNSHWRFYRVLTLMFEVVFVLIIACCANTKPVYKEYQTTNLQLILRDSIQVELPDTSLWATTWYLDQNRRPIQTKYIEWKQNKIQYRVTVVKQGESINVMFSCE